MAHTTIGLVWFHLLLLKLGISCPFAMTLKRDKKVAFQIIANPIFHDRTKHTEIDCHFTQKNPIMTNICHCVSIRRLFADVFIKLLGWDQLLTLFGNLALQFCMLNLNGNCYIDSVSIFYWFRFLFYWFNLVSFLIPLFFFFHYSLSMSLLLLTN